MNKKKVKELIEGLLQSGWMWGWPKHLNDEGKVGWDVLKEYYKEELNDGKDFKPDRTNVARAT